MKALYKREKIKDIGKGGEVMMMMFITPGGRA
jgi:hypothetical protein